MNFLKTTTICFIVLFFAQFSHAGPNDVHPCLTQHIREALALNKERKPLYAQISHGQSLIVSKKLIQLEWQLLLLAPLADAWAAPYQSARIPILCQDLIPMAHTPPFQSENPEGADSLENYQRPDLHFFENQMFQLFKARAYSQLAEFADTQIEHLNQKTRYNCLVKHMLESIRRIAALTPVHAKKSKDQTKISSEFLSRTLLRNHIRILKKAAEIDTLAAPLQAEGLPIVCQDVPYIPWP